MWCRWRLLNFYKFIDITFLLCAELVDESKLVKDEMKIAVSVNGKTRNVLLLPADASEEEVKNAAFADEKVAPFLKDKEIKKVIYVKGRILNIVAL